MNEPVDPGEAPTGTPPESGVSRDERWSGYLRQIREGNDRGLAGLYDESASLVYGLALRMLRNSADAEEAAADVYSHVWRSAASWDERRGSVATWLVMLCRSRCIDRIRARSSRPIMEETSSQTPADQVPGSTDREFVRQMLRQLDNEDRELIEAAFFEGLTHTELAARYGLPLGTIKTRIRSAVRRMRNLSMGYFA